MNFSNLQLFIDLKTCDRLRQWFSKRGSADNIQIQAIEVGDSDIDYQLSANPSIIRTLNAPYQVSKIKHKLIYQGSIAGGLAGSLTTFLRHINSTGGVESLYNYPPDSITYTLGIVPPTLSNGMDFNTILFNIGLTDKEGFIVFIQTLPDNYIDQVSGLPMRYQEEYDLNFVGLPNSWEVIPDVINGSFMIAKPSNYIFTSSIGTITISGRDTGIKKSITFNY